MKPLALLAVAFSMPAAAQDPPEAPRPRDVTEITRADPEALAALQRPGTVLFRADFEQDDALDAFFEVRGRDDGRVVLERDPAFVHRGRGALRCTAPAAGGRESGAGASGWLGRAGHEQVHFRRFIRFADDYDQGNLHHVGGGLAGLAGKGKWDEMGKAGVRPRGDDRFTCGFEPWRDWGRAASPGYMFLYTYWVDMRKGRDGNWWGNMLEPAAERRIVPPRGEWVCLEHMIRVNRVGEDGAAFDGELAAWIDGELYLHLTGIRWRTNDEVRIKRFGAGIYVHAATRANTVWYDELVVSTGWVGTGEGSAKGEERRGQGERGR